MSSRRQLLLGAVGLGLAGGCTRSGPTSGSQAPPSAAAPAPSSDPAEPIAALETSSGRTIGVYALDTGTGAEVRYRSDDRFPMCSTYKGLAVGAVLQQESPTGLREVIRFSKRDLVTYSPVTSRHLRDGMTVEQLCSAAVTVSDNTAANVLLERLGGPSALTRFFRTLGDPSTRLDRAEPDLNAAVPGDLRDTSTPRSLAVDYRLLTTQDILDPESRARLVGYLSASTTGATQIRAGVPSGWRVADKTGAGAYGTANDVGVLWPPGAAPVVLSVLTRGSRADDESRPELIAEVTRTCLAALGRS